MIEALAQIQEGPPEYIWQAKSRSKSRDRQEQPRTSRSKGKAIFYIGAVILLTDDNGEESQCKITHQTPDGRWWCEPL